MANKASKLKQAVNRTGRGLFDGFTPLNSREEEDSEQIKIASVIDEKEQNAEEIIDKNETTAVIENADLTEETTAKKDAEIEEKTELTKENADDDIASHEENEILSQVEKVEVKQPQKSTSRYEKEKFLLLDIRGYRDYVEHMAKASNMSATKYIRMLIDNDMKLNEDISREHKALEEKLKERSFK